MEVLRRTIQAPEFPHFSNYAYEYVQYLFVIYMDKGRMFK